ncbi:MAG: hypothetical protein FD177_2000 [Desulfovibrionaceae bacterium]|nr:MAG: hypothetical protein FD177_2000 [Desulfovibrionaceae bacterium]
MALSLFCSLGLHKTARMPMAYQVESRLTGAFDLHRRCIDRAKTSPKGSGERFLSPRAVGLADRVGSVVRLAAHGRGVVGRYREGVTVSRPDDRPFGVPRGGAASRNHSVLHPERTFVRSGAGCCRFGATFRRGRRRRPLRRRWCARRWRSGCSLQLRLPQQRQPWRFRSPDRRQPTGTAGSSGR